MKKTLNAVEGQLTERKAGRLGHTRATMAITMGSKAVRWSESGKIASVRIVLRNLGT